MEQIGNALLSSAVSDFAKISCLPTLGIDLKFCWWFVGGREIANSKRREIASSKRRE